jgi:hypothetical protein
VGAIFGFSHSIQRSIERILSGYQPGAKPPDAFAGVIKDGIGGAER